MDAISDNAAPAAASETRNRGSVVGGQTASHSGSDGKQTANNLSDHPNVRAVSGDSDEDDDPESEAESESGSGSESESESEPSTAPAKSNVRWTNAELDKLAELLNARRDLEANDSSLAKLKQPELFALAAQQMSQFFTAPRTGPACFTHWNRHGDKSGSVFKFNPFQSNQVKKAAQGSIGSIYESNRSRRVSALDGVQGEDDSDGDDEEEEPAPAHARVRSSKQKRKERVSQSEGPAKKRVVVRFTPDEMAALKKDAMSDYYPDMEHKQQLADEIGIDVKRVNRFFNNVQAGNYSFSRHLKNAPAPAAAVANDSDDDDDDSGLVDSPETAAGETPSRQTPDSVEGTGKGKRKLTPTAKALEAASSRKKRIPKVSAAMGDELRDIDKPTTLSQTRHQGLAAKRAAAAMSLEESGTSRAASGSGLKQPHGPSPLAAQAAPADAMEIDSDDESFGLSERGTSAKAPALSDRSRQPHAPVTLDSPTTIAAALPPSNVPVVVKRVVGSANHDIIPFDLERLKTHSGNVVREVRAGMSEEQLRRADNPPASAYDMTPVRKAAVPPTASELALAKLDLDAKNWKAEEAKLKGEIRDAVQSRAKLYKGNLLLKNRYDTGNKKLRELSAQYNNPECTEEQKVVLTKDFKDTQTWMIADKDAYNERRAHSAEIKKAIEAKKLKVKELKYFLLRCSQLKTDLVAKIALETKESELVLLKEANQAEIDASYAEITSNGLAAWISTL